MKRDKNYVVLICNNVENGLDEKVQNQHVPQGYFFSAGTGQIRDLKVEPSLKVQMTKQKLPQS